MDIPEGIENVKAATQRDRCVPVISFVVRFRATQRVLEEFVDAFPRRPDFRPYTPNTDSRYRLQKVPLWYIQPIERGRIGSGNLYGDFDIYIVPTEDGEFFVVYWDGYLKATPGELTEGRRFKDAVAAPNRPGVFR